MRYPNLEAEMRRNKVTQEDIAELVGVTNATIGNWMTGRSGEFTISASLKICQELFPNSSIKELFAREDTVA